MHYLYKITNQINGKVYIGQTNNPKRRWQAHKNAANKNKPEQIVQRALIKHGLNNFIFEVIATCKTWDDANNTETILVEQYNSLIPNGYNVSRGGYNAPKSEEFKKMMRNWHASLSDEEKEKRRKMHSESIKKLIETKGHPGLGTKRTPEHCERMRQLRLANPIDYTPEKRKKMSEAHIGLKDSEETKQRKSESIKKNWDKRNADRFATGDIKCYAPGCEVSGKAKYKIINDIRYCNKHGLRVLYNGTTDLSPKKPIVITEETRKKISLSRTGKGLGRVPHNKATLTQEQINFIINDPRSILQLSKEMNIGRKIISRIRRECK